MFQIPELPFQQLSRLDDRVGPVRDYDRRAGDSGLHRDQHQLTILLRHFEAVFIHQGRDIDLRVRKPELMKIPVDLRDQVFDLSGLLGVDLFDRAARRDQVDGHKQQVYLRGR